MRDIVEKLNNTNDFSGVQAKLFEIFSELAIPNDTYRHPPIFTVEEGIELGLHALIPGRHGKSLFLKNKAGELWLVVACEDTKVDLKTLSDKLQTKRFSFAKPEIMLEILGVTPGSATPFALISDTQKQVRVVLDEAFLQSTHCVFHPLENTYSTVISVDDLIRYIRFLGYDLVTLPLT